MAPSKDILRHIAAYDGPPTSNIDTILAWRAFVPPSSGSLMPSGDQDLNLPTIATIWVPQAMYPKVSSYRIFKETPF